MKIFLTSSHTLGWAGDLNPANGFEEALRTALKRSAQDCERPPINCLMISSYPDDVTITDRMAWEIRECFERARMPFDHFEVLDSRTSRIAASMIRRANFIILCGGHVPTENRFFQRLKLREKLSGFDGVLMGISAGSMNCAEKVYSTPELKGEAKSKRYTKYFDGLGYTDINIIPHYQDSRRSKIDGIPLMSEIVAPDTFNHPVWCLPDGSYFMIEDGMTLLCGKAYKMQNGVEKLVCRDGETKLLTTSGRLKKI